MRILKFNRGRGFLAIHQRERRTGWPRAIAVSALLGLTLEQKSLAAPTWTGAGAGDLWSDAANWSGGVPVNGDDVLFGLQGGGDSFLNFTLSLAEFRFAPAALPEHNFHVANGAALTLAGAGVVNDSVFGGPGEGTLRQQFFADAGGTLTFQNSATIGGNLPIDLSVLGGTIVGGNGGHLLFQNNATASAGVFTVIRNYGAAAAGAGGGEVRFRDDAGMGPTGILSNQGGEVAGAQGGQVVFQDRSFAAYNLGNTVGAGLGGRVIFQNQATTSADLFLTNDGAVHLAAGAEAVTQFLDDSVLAGFAQNLGGQVAGAAGGRIEFRNNARFDATGAAGDRQIFNSVSHTTQPGMAPGLGGITIFYDDSRITGAGAFIRNNAQTEAPNPGGIGGTTEFLDRSYAGQVTITNDGANSGASGTLSGRTFFRGFADAEDATIISNGGTLEAGAPGGFVEFSGNSTARRATLTATSGSDGGFGGRIVFTGQSDGGTARAVVEAGAVLDITSTFRFLTALGSVEGAGTFLLGNRGLAVGGNHRSTEVSGAIEDSNAHVPPGTFPGGYLQKEGDGTLTLSGASSMGSLLLVRGGVFVNGSLRVNNSFGASSGTTLGGSGTITGLVGVSGTLAPGAETAPGTLTINGELSTGSGSALNFQLGAPGIVGGPKNDLLTVTGNFQLGGVLNVADSGGFTLGSYRLINYGGALNDFGLTLGSVPAGFDPADFTIQLAIPGQVNLIVGSGAAVLHFDGAMTVANNVVNGGTGIWNNTETNWTNAAGSFNRAWGNRAAVFSGTAGIVTVTEPVTTSGMRFATTGYVINAAPGAATTLFGNAMVRVDPGATATVNAPLAGSGVLIKTDLGTLTLTGDSTYSGGTSLQDGLLIVDNAAGQGLGGGPVTVFGTPNSELDFINNSSAGGVSITVATAGVDSGFVTFHQSAKAGTATIDNQGNAANFGFGGTTAFFNTASADHAIITNAGSPFRPPADFFAPLGAGNTQFRDNTTAGTAIILNTSALAANALGGRTFFSGTATAGASRITNRGGLAPGSTGGFTEFSGTATAGASVIRNERAAAAGTAEGGNTKFRGTSLAGTATVTNEGAQNNIGAFGITFFYDGSNAQNGTFLNGASLAASTFGGRTVFYNTARAGSAVFDNEGSKVASGYAGEVFFFDSASADAATITNRGVTAASVTQGSIAYFYSDSKAGTATIVNDGSAFPALANPAGGWTQFREGASAERATIFNRAGTAANGGAGQTHFIGATVGKLVSADRATITNAGASFASAFPGLTQFSGTSNAAAATVFNEGGSAAGAAGGVTFFVNQSLAGIATITNRAAPAGALGGVTAFLNTASASEGTIHNVGAIDASGNSGRVEFQGSSTAAQSKLYADAGVGSAPGGRLLFYETSDGGAARAILGSDGAGGGFGVLDISQLTDTGMGLGSIEGSGIVSLGSKNLAVGTNHLNTIFSGVIRDGGVNAGTGGTLTKTGAGTLTLSGSSSYTGGTTLQSGALFVENAAGLGLGTGPVTVQPTFSGGLLYSLQASAGAVSITNLGSTLSTTAAVTDFTWASTAGNAAIVNGASLANGASGAYTQFLGTSRAGSATLQNLGSAFTPGPDGIGGGQTLFYENSNAQTATITNRGAIATSGTGGLTHFFASTEAGNSTIFNLPGAVSGATGARTFFSNSANADHATVTNSGATVAGAFGGQTSFLDTSSAGSGIFTNEAARVAGGDSGGTFFSNSSHAGTATFTNEGARTINSSATGVLAFIDSASAESASIINQGGTASGAIGGHTLFNNGATAENATIANQGATLSQANGGFTQFYASSTAGTGSIRNTSGQVSGALGGRVIFSGMASAGASTITNVGSAVFGAGASFTSFESGTSGGTATLIAEGATVAGGVPASVNFFDANAATSTLTAGSGSNSGSGGRIAFSGNSSGGLARAIIAGGPGSSAGVLDISPLTSPSMSLGSLEGGGLVSLGSKLLSVGLNNRSTTFSGLIRDAGNGFGVGGKLAIVGTGALTLSGANTYTGTTTIGDGAAANSGKIIAANISGSATGSGPVTVRRGGTLSGSGRVAGPVTLQPGGIIAPGDPVTLTLENTLTWDGGGVIRLALGPDQAGSDQLVIGGALIRGDAGGGTYSLELVDFGAVVGQTYDFLHFGSIQGFAAADFTFTGAVSGNLILANDRHVFTVTSVPEPSIGGLLLLSGTLLLRRRFRLARPNILPASDLIGKVAFRTVH